MRKKRIIPIEVPGSRDEAADAAAHKVLYNPYLLTKILTNLTSVNDRKNVELTCKFFKDVSRGSVFQSGSYGNAIECYYMHFEPKMTCQVLGESFTMETATREQNPDYVPASQPNGVENLKNFFMRFSRRSMSVHFGGTPAEYAPYIKPHTVILTKDFIKCFITLNNLRHLCLRNVFLEASASDYIRTNLLIKSNLLALCLHNVSCGSTDVLRNLVSLASGHELKRLTLESPLAFVLLMRLLASNPRYKDVRIETVSLYCSKEVMQFVNDIKYVERIAAKHIRYIHLSLNFYGTRRWEEYKSFKQFLEKTSLNIESLDVRIYFPNGPWRFPSIFNLKELFNGLSRHRNIKKFCLSGKLDACYASVIQNAITALSMLEFVKTVVFHQVLKVFGEPFWSHAAENLPNSIENLTISSAHNLKDQHVDALLLRLPRLRRFALHGARNLTIDGARRIFSSTYLTHVAVLYTIAVSKGISELLSECSGNLQAIMAAVKKKRHLDGAVKKDLEGRYPIVQFHDSVDEAKSCYDIATSEQELKVLKDISKFFYCDQCDVDVLTSQYC
ncbi:hypothetical protein QR680_005028 [Steinernema hermaphroditum]|uniref:F-box domain-containing protein n=1 Tax=Steinernema hermaphroditum TaxID=289476 RepID=A0AA39LUZ1_9BILA|nr:hypothetical protein QR680_005028 [Steinernema hermaphroditum]